MYRSFNNLCTYVLQNFLTRMWSSHNTYMPLKVHDKGIALQVRSLCTEHNHELSKSVSLLKIIYLLNIVLYTRSFSGICLSNASYQWNWRKKLLLYCVWRLIRNWYSRKYLRRLGKWFFWKTFVILRCSP